MEEKIIEAQEETKVEPVSPAPEEKVEEAPVEEKPKKKLNIQMPKIFHNKVFVFVLLVLLTFIGGLLLFFMDTDNAYRRMIGVSDKSVAWLTGIFKMDVTIVTWLIFAIASGAVFFLFFALWFGSSIKGKIRAKHKAKTGQDYSKKGNIILEVVFWVIFGLIAAGFAVGIGFMFGEVGQGIKMRFEAYGGFGGFAMAVLKFILTLLLLIFCIALIPLLIAALFALFKGIVLFFGGLVGGVAKNVMKSQNFQETYAAAQAASNKINELANQLPKSISVVVDPNSPTGYSNGGGGGSGAKSALGQSSYDGILFPALDAIDKKYHPEEKTEGLEEAKPVEAVEAAEVVEEKPIEEKVEEKPAEKAKKKQDLSILVDEFQSYLVAEEKLYFSKKVLRTFIAGMSASRLLLLEGLSGTGKSSLPRSFQKYIGGKSTFLQVQATWRDRTDIIGYFSDLTGYYKETELLKSIYESSYTPEEVNLIVLDEMNISRAEYYFADFLSIYEYPSELWKIQLMQTSKDMILPEKIDKGSLQIPTNIWFIGTINIDDSTFTVTDKVYDRAIVINFNAINEPFEATYKKRLEPISYSELVEFFDDCQNNPKLCLTKEDKHQIYELLAYLDEEFEIKIGNRIFNQIELFVPVFVGLGGNKLDAIDMMISAKIFRKLDLVFIMDMADSLIKLQRFLNAHFKKGALPLCEAKINSLLRKYQ